MGAVCWNSSSGTSHFSRHSIRSHPFLRRASVGAILKSDHFLPSSKLLLCKFSSVFFSQFDSDDWTVKTILLSLWNVFFKRNLFCLKVAVFCSWTRELHRSLPEIIFNFQSRARGNEFSITPRLRRKEIPMTKMKALHQVQTCSWWQKRTTQNAKEPNLVSC